jgi:hypothetical protein
MVTNKRLTETPPFPENLAKWLIKKDNEWFENIKQEIKRKNGIDDNDENTKSNNDN